MKSWPPVILISALALTGCSSGLPTDFGPPESVYGTQLGSSYVIIRPAWSLSGERLFFYQSRMGTFHSLSVATDDVVTLGSVSGRPAGRANMQTGHGGSYVYGTVTADDLSDAIYAVPTAGGEPELVIRGLEWPWFAVSHDETRFAVIRRLSSGNNSVAVFDRPSGNLLPVTADVGFGLVLLSLSPDGGQLVYGATQAHYSPNASELRLRDLASGGELTLSIPPPENGIQTIGNVHWKGALPQIIVAQKEETAPQFDIVVADFAHDTPTLYGSVPAGDPSAGGAWAVAWSSEGAVAVWTPVAIGPQVCSSICISRNWIHWRLYLLTGPQAPAQLIAEMIASEGPAWLEFSPDGSTLGYILEHDLFILPVR